MSKLWSGESVWCICGHHVVDHQTSQKIGSIELDGEIYRHCIFKSGECGCSCDGFRSYRQ